MNSDSIDHLALTRYLLGELSEQECLEIEQRCLDDDQTFEQLEAIEAELTDDYVRGMLGGRRRKQFEKRILNAPGGPGSRQSANLDLAKLITGQSRSERSPIVKLKAWIEDHSSPFWLLRTSAIAATLVAAIGIGWFSLERPSSKSLPESQLAKGAAPAKQSVAAQPNAAPQKNLQPALTATSPRRPAASTNPRLVATFVLTAGSVRSEGEANEISIPLKAKKVRFRIELSANPLRSYDASLNRVEGERLFSQNNVKPRYSRGGAALIIELPAGALPLGTSILTIRGAGHTRATELPKYVIRVSHR